MEKKTNTIKLTESQLFDFIEEGVNQTLKEYAEKLHHKEDDGQHNDDDSDNTDGCETEEQSNEREKKRT